MPVGPSHRRSSRSSSSRSFSSRSSSSSRSRSTSYSRSSNYSRGHHHHHYHYDDDDDSSVSLDIGFNFTARGWAKFGIFLGFVAVIICMIIGVVLLMDNVSYHITMRKDASEYQEIIDNANSGMAGYFKIHIGDIRKSWSNSSGGYPTEYGFYGNNDYVAEAYCEVQKNGVNYYYIDFEFRDDNGNYVSGTTYTYYSESALLGLSSLDLVYTKEYDSDGSWDVIQENYSLSDNIDYWYTGKNITTGVILILVAVGLFVLFVWCSMRLSKSKDKESDAKTSSSATEISPNKSAQLQDNSDKFKVCTYCGCHVRIGDDRCNACGSRDFRKPKDGEL